MTLILQAFAWIFDPAHYVTTASGGIGIPEALVEHLKLTGISLVIAAIIAVPIGLYIGHSGRWRATAIVASNITRALPSLGILSILLVVITDPAFLPAGYLANVIVFVILGIPPILAGAYSGLEQVDRQTIDSARAVGMTEFQILRKVEIPLGASLIVGGIRSATLQIIATVTISSILGQPSLGTYIEGGYQQADYVQMTAGAILVAALALVADGILAAIQRFCVPRGVSRGTVKKRNTARRDDHVAAITGTPTREGN
jgi:osmoprotectant transport system permease protein